MLKAVKRELALEAAAKQNPPTVNGSKESKLSKKAKKADKLGLPSSEQNIAKSTKEEKKKKKAGVEQDLAPLEGTIDSLPNKARSSLMSQVGKVKDRNQAGPSSLKGCKRAR